MHRKTKDDKCNEPKRIHKINRQNFNPRSHGSHNRLPGGKPKGGYNLFNFTFLPKVRTVCKMRSATGCRDQTGPTTEGKKIAPGFILVLKKILRDGKQQ